MKYNSKISIAINKKIICIIFTAILFNVQSSFSQNLKTDSYSIGYLNESIFRSGLIIGIDYIYYSWQKKKPNSKKEITMQKTRTILANPQIGVYHHTHNHTALITNIDFILKSKKKNSLWSHSWALGVGMLTQFNVGITYVLEVNDEIVEKKNASRTYFNPTVSYYIEREIFSNIKVFSKFGLGIKAPYNTWISPTTQVAIGTKFNLNK